MAYKSNEVQEQLHQYAKNSRGEYIRVAKVTNNDKVSFDIRQLYTNDDGELCFTQKGVRIGEEDMIDVLAILLDNIDSAFIDDIIMKSKALRERVDSGEIDAYDDCETEESQEGVFEEI